MGSDVPAPPRPGSVPSMPASATTSSHNALPSSYWRSFMPMPERPRDDVAEAAALRSVAASMRARIRANPGVVLRPRRP